MAQPAEVPEEVRQLAGAWWLLLLVGLISIAAGVIVLVEPHISLATLAVIAGIFLLIDGVYEVVSSFGKRTEHRGLVALLGILSLIVGVLLVRHPTRGVAAIALLVGIWLIAFGTVRFIEAFAYSERRGWHVLLALVEVIAGIVIVSSPNIGVATLALFVGIAFILRGVGLCLVAWALRQLKHGISGVPPVAPAT